MMPLYITNCVGSLLGVDVYKSFVQHCQSAKCDFSRFQGSHCGYFLGGRATTLLNILILFLICSFFSTLFSIGSEIQRVVPFYHVKEHVMSHKWNLRGGRYW